MPRKRAAQPASTKTTKRSVKTTAKKTTKQTTKKTASKATAKVAKTTAKKKTSDKKRTTAKTARKTSGRSRPSMPASGAASTLIAEAVDPQWLRVRWTPDAANADRAAAAMGADWHRAGLALRVLAITGPSSARVVRDVMLPPEVGQTGRPGQWFVQADAESRQVRVQLGYTPAESADDDAFYAVLGSEAVTLPAEPEAIIDEGAPLPPEIRAELADRVAAPGGPPLALTARLLVDGQSRGPVRVDGEPVPLRTDGCFTLTRSLDGRLILTLEADPETGGPTQRAIVAVDASVRMLDPE